MIQSFADRQTRRFFEDGTCPAQWRAFSSVALRKLDYLDAAAVIDDLRAPPGNRLEALKGNRARQYSIRINQQWRICFHWTANGPEDVEIVDYH